MRTIAAITALLWLYAAAALCQEPVAFHSPGFPPSHFDAQGRLVEDWGTLAVELIGEGVADGPVQVEAIRLDELIPAARAVAQRGAVTMTTTAYRAPIFPGGVDVLTVRLENRRQEPTPLGVKIALPEGARLGAETVRAGGRTLMALPANATKEQKLREWGYCDEATALAGWAKPEVACDPAFRNIRAGLGGVPIVYRFAIAPGSKAQVLLGLCESHWDEAGQRIFTCAVEGAQPVTVDPIARWGRHRPGVLLFAAHDADGNGVLEVSVSPAAGTRDRNPILNVIWVFPPDPAVQPEAVLSGSQNEAAIYYVDVGGSARDQSIFPEGHLQYQLTLAPGEARELTFLVACKGSSAPVPAVSAWTPDALFRAAYEVWRDWPKQ